MDTIFALASSPGKSGVAVVRVSGPKAPDLGRQLIGDSLRPRYAHYGTICNNDGQHIDDALILFFEGPKSFTGEDVLELQIHGSTAVVSAVLAFLGAKKGLRHAEPGEFTRRALENNKLDLSQVEALSDLVEAETEGQRLQAQRVLKGGLRNRCEGWRTQLIRAVSLLEVSIDFADEDVPEDVTPEVIEILAVLSSSFDQELSKSAGAERVRTGYDVAILGAPNVGKSSLLNYLVGRDAAITSKIAGTTRDIIEVQMDLSGLPVTFVDTAGVRETSDEIEREGIKRAIMRAEEADIALFLSLEGDLPDGLDDMPNSYIILTKGDITGRDDAISVKTGAGIDNLIDKVVTVLSEKFPSSGVLIRQRHLGAVSLARDSVNCALNMLQDESAVFELASEELRRALHQLEMLVGRVDVENILDEIFSSFCLGK